MEGRIMARTISETGRIELRVDPAEKAMLARAAALEHTDVTGFILRSALPAAREAIDRAERLRLSERDSLRVLDLLDNPPPPNARLLEAARALARNDK